MIARYRARPVREICKRLKIIGSGTAIDVSDHGHTRLH